ncbi:hypothetical protein D3C76_996210 [compost metagenome]
MAGSESDEHAAFSGRQAVPVPELVYESPERQRRLGREQEDLCGAGFAQAGNDRRSVRLPENGEGEVSGRGSDGNGLGQRRPWPGSDLFRI